MVLACVRRGCNACFRQEWVITLRDKNIIKPVHIDTDLNRADIFTKILPTKVFQGHRDALMKPCDMDNSSPA